MSAHISFGISTTLSINKAVKRRSFRSIDKNQTPILELNCPAILVLANSVEAKELREELEDFVVEHLSYEKSHLVRKTCAYALKTIYFPADDSSVKEFFVLLASLEETQVPFLLFQLNFLSSFSPILLNRHSKSCQSLLTKSGRITVLWSGDISGQAS